MQIKLWGVRGSLPSPLLPETIARRFESLLTQYERLRESGSAISASKYLSSLPSHSLGGFGGNTSCAEVWTKTSRLLIDGGSGLQPFSDHIMRTDPSAQEFHFYFTHYHWDHLIGLPFFVPLYMKGKTIHFYAVEKDMESSLRTLFKKPNFPVPFEGLAAEIKFHTVEARKPFKVGDFSVTPYGLDHPDPCWGARIEYQGKSIAWCVDNEGVRTERQALGEDYKLYHEADLMVFDAQYSFGEGLSRINWGHSSGPIGIDIAIRENIKQALFMHHDPSASDEGIFQAEMQTHAYFNEVTKTQLKAGLPAPKLIWRFAREGDLVSF
jgi:phosphoribosyl 1,2-cyclic phosphodiesterase